MAYFMSFDTSCNIATAVGHIPDLGKEWAPWHCTLKFMVLPISEILF
jgi:hypothetical protein